MVHSLGEFFFGLLTVHPSLFLPLLSLSLSLSLTEAERQDHIRYHAANPASAANQVANRTCPVGCRRTIIASWHAYAVPPEAAAAEGQQKHFNKITAIASEELCEGLRKCLNVYPFW